MSWQLNTLEQLQLSPPTSWYRPKKTKTSYDVLKKPVSGKIMLNGSMDWKKNQNLQHILWFIYWRQLMLYLKLMSKVIYKLKTKLKRRNPEFITGHFVRNAGSRSVSSNSFYILVLKTLRDCWNDKWYKSKRTVLRA